MRLHIRFGKGIGQTPVACSFCKRRLPNKIQRLYFYAKEQYKRGYKSKAVCGSCLLKINKQLKKKQLEQWDMECVAKKV